MFLDPDWSDGRFGILQQGGFKVRIGLLERPGAVPEAALVEPSGPTAECSPTIEIVLARDFGFVLHVRVGIQHESATRRNKKAMVVGRLLQQALGELQTERQRLTDKVDVVIGLVHRIARRQRIANHVDGVGLERAPGVCHGQHAERTDRSQTCPNSPSCRRRALKGPAT